ncbi:MAG: hypothetical protein WD181_00890 [Solirubrobacterales bacterium]
MIRLEEIRDRLNEITGELGSEGVADTRASELAAEAAELTAEAAREAAVAVDHLGQGS